MKRNSLICIHSDLPFDFAHKIAAIPRLIDVEQLPEPLLLRLFDVLLAGTLPDTNGVSSRVVTELIERDKGYDVVEKLRSLLPNRFSYLPSWSSEAATSPIDADDDQLLTALTVVMLQAGSAFENDKLSLLSDVAFRKLFTEWLFVWKHVACPQETVQLPKKASRQQLRQGKPGKTKTKTKR